MSQAATGGSDSFVDEAPEDLIAPSPDVFSYFLLTAPSERKKHKRFTIDALTSYILVFAVLFIQCTLLWCVSNKVIAKNVAWQNGIMNTGKDWDIVDPESTGCNDGKSLCRVENGTFTCAPPSVQLIGRWEELDTNKDGVWTRDEVMAKREALRCKFAVDPIEVYNVLGRLLKAREQFIWLHPDVKKGDAIPKAYFQYIKGDVAMCGYRNGDMCGNLLKRGVFDSALNHSNIPRIGNSTSSALEYCHSLLDVGGICERNLPSTYSVWKIKSVQECGKPEYSQYLFKHPNGADQRSLLEVDYTARESYEVAKTATFRIYKTCIIFVWMLLIVSQLREVRRTVTWIYQVPLMTDNTPREEWESKDVISISERHRIVLTIVNAVRAIIMGVLLYVGLNFLARQTDYIGLLLDGVALIFIVEVEEIVYSRVIRTDVRLKWEKGPVIRLQRIGIFGGHADAMDLAFFVVLVIAATCFLWYYTTTLVEPLYDALQCTCLSEGESCREAHAFSTKFWDQYWSHEVPASIGQINSLKAGHAFVQESHASPLPGSHPAAAAPHDFHATLTLAHQGRHHHPHHAHSLGKILQRHSPLRHLLPEVR